MKDNIPQFLQDKLKQKKAFVSKFPDEIKQFMIAYSNYYNWEITDLTIIFKAMKKGYTDLPKCGYKDCEQLTTINKNANITMGCCFDHSFKINYLLKHGVENPMDEPEVVEKIKKTMLKNYGAEFALQTENSKNKFKETMLKNYGVEFSMQSKKLQQKSKDTCIEKYGVSNISKLSTIKIKKEKTLLKNYGCTNIMRNNEIKSKHQQTVYKNYGVKNPMQSKIIQQKSKDTCIEKYGVEYAIQNPIILDKIQKAMYNYKDYIWKSGNKTRLQGYEPIVLKELENQGYTYDKILTSTKDMPEIWYEFEGKKSRYYPDFFIPTENLIIEVKSQYTLDLHWERNQKKFQAVKDLGFNFKLEIR